MKTIMTFDQIEQSENTIIAKKTILGNEIYFEGHYPHNPIFPGVFQIELAYNAAALLFNMESKLSTIKRFRFFKTVKPLDTVVVKAKAKEYAQSGVIVDVTLLVEEEKVSSGTMIFAQTPMTFAQTQNDFGEEMFDDIRNIFHIQSNIDEVLNVLPHRYPFVHVDRILNIKLGQEITTLKNITASDYVYWGRPAGAAFPKTIMIEALAQSAAILGMKQKEYDGVPLFGGISGVSFYDDVYPGDQMIMHADLLTALSDSGIIKGRIFVGERMVCDIDTMIYAVIEP